jgi:hypothetical protein
VTNDQGAADAGRARPLDELRQLGWREAGVGQAEMGVQEVHAGAMATPMRESAIP